MHRYLRRPYPLVTLALLSSRVHIPLAFSPCKVSKNFFVSFASQTDDIVVASEDLLVFRLNHTVGSTQEEAKRLLEEHDCNTRRMLAVIAKHQEAGRGTGGRSWVASKGNLFLTCAISMKLIPNPTLLPLGVGIVVAERLSRYTKTRPTVKWPNDVLMDGNKIAGTLIENFRVGSQDWWLVGIGVNVDSHPSQLPPEKGGVLAKSRPATCLQTQANEPDEIPTALELGIDLASRLEQWTKKLQRNQDSSVASEWKSWAKMGMTYTIRETGEEVTTLDIEDDGRLRVIGSDGQMRLLVTDYLY